MVGERETRPRTSGGKPTASAFAHRQGQYLAYIHLYRKLHRMGPAQADLVRYFRVAPPTVHQMIVTLKKLGLVVDEPGVPRSIRVTIPKEEIPELEDEFTHDD